jgi:hypothetical protein
MSENVNVIDGPCKETLKEIKRKMTFKQKVQHVHSNCVAGYSVSRLSVWKAQR